MDNQIIMPNKIERLPISILIPYANNARTHTTDNVEKLMASIREFGWTQPVLIGDKNEIIAGHGRVLAAEQLSIKEIPCIRLSNLTPHQVRAYRIADNQLGLDSEWDIDLLAAELQELKLDGFDLTPVGFSLDNLEQILKKDDTSHRKRIGEDDIIAPQTITVSQRGQIWELGAHRVACGDSTDPRDVNPLLAGVSPELMVTDPPYGVNYNPAWRHELGLNGSKRTGEVTADSRADWRGAWAFFGGNVAYIWHSGLYGAISADSLITSGFDIRAQIIWVKQNSVIGRGHYHWRHECCFYAVRHGQQGNWMGDRKQSTVWEIANAQEEPEQTIHGTQKPVECMRRPMLNHTKEGAVIYDPFLGSGSTLIAAESIGRICIGVEIDPVYIDVIIRRWQAYTGKQATCDGVTFEEMEMNSNGKL